MRVVFDAADRPAVDGLHRQAVAAGALDLPWMTVGVYDAVVAMAQLGLLAQGTFDAA